MATFTERVRERIKDFLQITEAPKGAFLIEEKFDFASNALKNRIWYRGEAHELDQFYRQAGLGTQPFWGARGTQGLGLRKIHTGIPSVIVDTLADIVIADLTQVVIEDDEQQVLWEEIAEENDVKKAIKRALKQMLAVGDGAFKISFDAAISTNPIIEFYSAERIEPVYRRGRLQEIIFKTVYRRNKRKYVLNEHYGFGYVSYKLYENDKPRSLETLEETTDLEDITFDASVMMAELWLISESDKHPGRGVSIYEKKTDAFDALDESWSQWMDALRAGRSKTYIPASLVPRDPESGTLRKPNTFDNQFIAIGDSMEENASNRIDVIQPAIPTDNYLQTYITSLDLALQGLVSPSTLGIDVKKLDNAEAQREKEKATLYTRSAIVEALQDLVPRLVECALKSYWLMSSKPLRDIECSTNFGEYATPSFESLVETFSNPSTPMSIEARVEEIWGDSRDEKWKALEVERIKHQTGLSIIEEPALEPEL